MGSWLRSLFGYQVATQNGIPVPSRTYIEFPSGSLTDDPINQRTIYDPVGVGVSPTFSTVTASQLNVGAYSLIPGPVVPTTDGSTVNLLSAAVALSARQSLRLRYTARGVIVGQTVMTTVEIVRVATINCLSTTATLGGGGESGSPATMLAAPFCDSIAGVQTVTGAVDDGTGQIKLTLPTTQGFVAGSSTLAVSSVGGVPNATGTWIVDSVPDGTHAILRGSTFAGTFSSGGTCKALGSVSAVLSTNTIQIQAAGLLAAPWKQSESVPLYGIRYSPAGAYLYTTAGAVLGTGTGPSGSGSGIADGAAVCERLTASSPNVPITWEVFLETWLLQG